MKHRTPRAAHIAPTYHQPALRFVVERFVGGGRYPYLWKSIVLVAKRP